MHSCGVVNGVEMEVVLVRLGGLGGSKGVRAHYFNTARICKFSCTLVYG